MLLRKSTYIKVFVTGYLMQSLQWPWDSLLSLYSSVSGYNRQFSMSIFTILFTFSFWNNHYLLIHAPTFSCRFPSETQERFFGFDVHQKEYTNVAFISFRALQVFLMTSAEMACSILLNAVFILGTRRVFFLVELGGFFTWTGHNPSIETNFSLFWCNFVTHFCPFYYRRHGFGIRLC